MIDYLRFCQVVILHTVFLKSMDKVILMMSRQKEERMSREFSEEKQYDR